MRQARSRNSRVRRTTEYLRIAIIGAAIIFAVGVLFPLLKCVLFGGPPLQLLKLIRAAGFAVAFAVVFPLLFWSAAQLLGGRLWRRPK
jgi:hypothetical protein